MTLDKMKLRRLALEDLLDTYAKGGTMIEGEQSSNAFKQLSVEGKDLVRAAYLKEIGSISYNYPEGYDGEELAEEYL